MINRLYGIAIGACAGWAAACALTLATTWPWALPHGP